MARTHCTMLLSVSVPFSSREEEFRGMEVEGGRKR
jgi:hypothetical protein